MRCWGCMSNALPVPVPGAGSRRVPSMLAVARQQFRLISASRRVPMLIVLLCGIPLIYNAYESAPYRFRSEDVLPFVTVLLASIAWPIMVWAGEAPARRSYHRTLPVDHIRHDLLKVLAGAVWLMLGVALVLSAFVLISWASGLGMVLSRVSPAAYINYFTGTLIIYLFASILPILTNKPLEWLLGVTIGSVAVGLLGDIYFGQLGLLSLFMDVFVYDELGLLYALGGAYTSQPWDFLMKLTSRQPPAQPYLGMWLLTTFLWITLASALVCVASAISNRRSHA